MNSTKKNGTTAQIAGDRSHINYIRIKKRMGATAQIVRDRQLYYMLIPFFIWYILMYYSGIDDFITIRSLYNFCNYAWCYF